jgi:hypothetical protein
MCRSPRNYVGKSPVLARAPRANDGTRPGLSRDVWCVPVRVIHLDREGLLADTGACGPQLVSQRWQG